MELDATVHQDIDQRVNAVRQAYVIGSPAQNMMEFEQVSNEDVSRISQGPDRALDTFKAPDSAIVNLRLLLRAALRDEQPFPRVSVVVDTNFLLSHLRWLFEYVSHHRYFKVFALLLSAAQRAITDSVDTHVAGALWLSFLGSFCLSWML